MSEGADVSSGAEARLSVRRYVGAVSPYLLRKKEKTNSRSLSDENRNLRSDKVGICDRFARDDTTKRAAGVRRKSLRPKKRA